MNINKTYELPFSVDKVYANWVSSNTVIAPATSMDIVPQVGRHYRLVIDTPEFKSKNEGVFLIVEANSHVKYTWEWNHDGEVSEIDVKFSSTDKGTAILIEHTGFKQKQSVEMHDQGWDSYIEGFSRFLSSVG
jgi:uncharacterized protein YndB with AHSA1/START domain